MRWLYRLRQRFRTLFRRSRLEGELEEEMRFHLEQSAARGVDPSEARRAFGNVTLIREETREMWGWNTLWGMCEDLRHAARGLRKTPGFAFTAILTLAAGTGAGTALFTIVDSVLLRPLQYRDSGSLITIWQGTGFLTEYVGPNPRFADEFRKRADVLSDLALVQSGTAGLSLGTDHPTLVGTVRATPNLFEILQVTPFLGSLFRPEQGVPGRDGVAVLTHAAWRQWFREDPGVVGKTIRIRNQTREVIGVLPPDFVFPNGNELRAYSASQAWGVLPQPSVFLPVALEYENFNWFGEFGNWVAIARTKPGILAREAQADLDRVQKRVLNEIPPNRPRAPGMQVLVTPMQEAIVSGSRRRIWLLMAAVMGLLLIACLNLANTQLARAVSRSREVGVRAALGAPRWRLLWTAMSESVLLALLGGAAGVVLAFVTLGWLRRQAMVDLPRLNEVEMNWLVLVFAVGLTLGASLLFGFLPAVRGLRNDPRESLQSGGARGTAPAGARRAQTALVALQVFGCVVLLSVTALFAGSLFHLVTQDKGFETSRVAFVEALVAGPAYAEQGGRVAFVDGVLENVRNLPGVEAASWGSAVPLQGESWIEGIQRLDGGREGQEEAIVNLRWVTAGYFETHRHRLAGGRSFAERDRDANSLVISESTAKVLWPGQDAVGRRARIQGKEWTVAGVVMDARSTSLKTAPAKMAYLPHTQARPTTNVFFARGREPGANLVAAMREAVWRRDPQATIVRSGTMDDRIEDSLRAERFQTLLLAAFGGTALLLAMLGIYGVLSYSVAARQREIGVRMALGATRRSIYVHTLGELSLPVVTGLAGGLATSVAATRAIRSMLYGIDGPDGALLAGVSAVFLVCAFAAGFVPARRAASVEPMRSLRTE